MSVRVAAHPSARATARPNLTLVASLQPADAKPAHDFEGSIVREIAYLLGVGEEFDARIEERRCRMGPLPAATKPRRQLRLVAGGAA